MLCTTSRKPPTLSLPLGHTETCGRIQELQHAPHFTVGGQGVPAEPPAEQTDAREIYLGCKWFLGSAERRIAHSVARLSVASPKITTWAQTADKPLPFGTNFSELLNIQKRDCPLFGPSLRNSWPSPLPHLPQDT